MSNKKLTFANGGYISLDDLTELLDGRAEGSDNEKLFDDMTKLVNDALKTGLKRGKNGKKGEYEK